MSKHQGSQPLWALCLQMEILLSVFHQNLFNLFLPTIFNWSAISSVIEASASNQSTGSRTGVRFVKNEPRFGFGDNWSIIWSLIKTWHKLCRVLICSPKVYLCRNRCAFLDCYGCRMFWWRWIEASFFELIYEERICSMKMWQRYKCFQCCVPSSLQKNQDKDNIRQLYSILCHCHKLPCIQ